MTFERMLRYCALLEANNERSWFHAHHDLYEEAKGDFTDLVEQLKFRVADLCTPDLAERLIFVRAKDLLYRIPRDMRVHHNAPPYNPTWRAYLSGDRHALTPVGYFLKVAPGDASQFGTGAWCPDPGWTRHFRQEISERYEEFDALVSACGLPLEGEKLKRVPRDFDPLDPAGEFLKYKEWLVSVHFRDAELTDFDAFEAQIARAVERMEPLRQFFNGCYLRRQRQPWEEAQA